MEEAEKVDEIVAAAATTPAAEKAKAVSTGPKSATMVGKPLMADTNTKKEQEQDDQDERDERNEREVRMPERGHMQRQTESDKERDRKEGDKQQLQLYSRFVEKHRTVGATIKP